MPRALPPALLLLLAVAAVGTAAAAPLLACTAPHGDGYCLEAELTDAGTAWSAGVLLFGEPVYGPETLDAASVDDEHCFRSVGCTVCLDLARVQVGGVHARLCGDITRACDGGAEPEVYDLPCLETTSEVDAEALPLLPDSFSAVIEANFVNKQQTLEMREFRDAVSGRVRQELHHDETSVVHLIDTGLGVRAVLEEGAPCEVSPLEGGGPGLDASTGGLRSASEMFQRTRSGANYTFRGNSTVRGIAAHWWRENVTESFTFEGVTRQLEYTLDWHFARPDWSWVHSHDHRLPLLAELSGTEYNLTAPGGRDDPANAVDFHHRYEWVAFTPGVPDASLMRVPAGGGCSLPENRPVPKFERNFRTTLEMTLSTRRRTAGIRELYDFDRNRARFDFGLDPDTGVERSAVVDATAGVQYVIETSPDGGVTCERSDLGDDYGRIIDPQKHHLRPLEPGHPPHLSTGEEPVYHYSGQELAPGRGILCDVWHATYANVSTVSHDGRSRVTVNFAQTLYVSVDGWASGATGDEGEDDAAGLDTHPVPVLVVNDGSADVEGSGTFDFVEHVHYVDVSFVEPPLSDTDVHAACFPGSGDDGSGNSSPSHEATGVSKGATAAMTVVLTLVGALVGALLYRRSAQKHHHALTASLSTESQMNEL